MGLSDPFPYDERHKVIVCRQCATCLGPEARAWERHLRAKPHRLTGAVLRSTIDRFRRFELRTRDELRLGKPEGNTECEPIDGLATYTGYRCTHEGCTYLTRRKEKLMYEHLPGQHRKKARQHCEASPLWVECRL